MVKTRASGSQGCCWRTRSSFAACDRLEVLVFSQQFRSSSRVSLFWRPSVRAIVHAPLILMEPARADPEGRADETKSRGVELSVPARGGFHAKHSRRNKSSVDMGGKEVVARRTPSVGSCTSRGSYTSRRGSLSMLAQQLRMLEAHKDGEVRCVVAFVCVPMFHFAHLINR